MPTSQSFPVRLLQLCTTLLASSSIFLIAFNALNSDAFSDPKLNFVVSQAILEHGTIYLDAYQNDIILGKPFVYYTNMLDILPYNAHFYHYFPTGPSVLSLPFVWIALQFGMDMRGVDNFWLQNLLSALSIVVLFWILLRIGRILTRSYTAALTIALVSILGSGLISTLGVAFWSLNFTTIFYALILLLILHWEVGAGLKPAPTSPIWQPVVIGVLLFAAFYARASAVAFILPIFAYLIWRDWRFAIRTMGTSAVLFGLFLVWSRMTFGRWLPDYYEAERLTVERIPVYIGVIGSLFSPSRGLFIFSPMYAIALLGIIGLWRDARTWLCLTWFGLTLYLSASAATWYGGWAFGPRLLTDTTIAWVLLTFLLYARLRERVRWLIPIAAVYLGLGGFAIYINSYQGLYNQATSHWNRHAIPKTNIHTPHEWGDMFNWEYVQWQADFGMLCAKEKAVAKHYLDVSLPIGRIENAQWLGLPEDDVIIANDILWTDTLPLQPILVGWLPPDGVSRWSACPEASIYFDLDKRIEGSELYTITLRVYGIKTQPVRVSLNGRLLVDTVWDDSTPINGEIFITTHFTHLLEGERNHLLFEFPEVQPVSRDDQRWLGIAFAGLKLEGLPP